MLFSVFIYAHTFTSLNQQQCLLSCLQKLFNKLKNILMLQRSITSFLLGYTQVIILLSNHLLILWEWGHCSRFKIRFLRPNIGQSPWEKRSSFGDGWTVSLRLRLVWSLLNEEYPERISLPETDNMIDIKRLQCRHHGAGQKIEDRGTPYLGKE